jgi:hypothetical protein
MGTRSTIALEYADGTVEQVYCHWDGYLDHNGEILNDHYTDPFKLQALINSGDMSTLGEDVEDCKFYSERGEVCPARKYKGIGEYFATCQQEEYDYILRPIDGKAVWFVRCWVIEGAWVPLPVAAQLQAAEEVDEDEVY